MMGQVEWSCPTVLKSNYKLNILDFQRYFENIVQIKRNKWYVHITFGRFILKFALTVFQNHYFYRITSNIK